MDVDRLALLRNVPERATAAGSSRVRVGNLVGGPGSEVTVRAEGVIDFRRRCTFVSQEMPAPVQQSRGSSWLGRRIVGLAVKLMSGDFLYVDGTVFRRGRDGRFVSAEGRSESAPRHPNDPAWPVDALYGIMPPIERLDDELAEERGHMHLAGVADLAAADRAAPHGVRPSIAARGSELKEVRFHAWLNADHLPVRISTEHSSAMPTGGRFWSAIEFWDYGLNLDQTWEPSIIQLLSGSDPDTTD